MERPRSHQTRNTEQSTIFVQDHNLAIQAKTKALISQDLIESLVFYVGCFVIVTNVESKYVGCPCIIHETFSQGGKYIVKIFEKENTNRSGNMFTVDEIYAWEMEFDEKNVSELPRGVPYFNMPANIYSSQLHRKKRKRKQMNGGGEPISKRLANSGKTIHSTDTPVENNHTTTSLETKQHGQCNIIQPCNSNKRDVTTIEASPPCNISNINDAIQNDRINKITESETSNENNQTCKLENMDGYCEDGIETIHNDVYETKDKYTDGKDPHITATAKAKILLNYANSLFRPGCRFVGDIVIPGVENCLPARKKKNSLKRHSYALAIVRRVKDELGNEYFAARHAAYTDEQAVHVKIEIVECYTMKNSIGAEYSYDTVEDADNPPCKRHGLPFLAKKCKEPVVKLTYSDLETNCVGVVNLKHGRIQGLVYQIKEGQEGFFYNSSEATHTFDLLLECYDKEYVDRSAQLLVAKQDRVGHLYEWFQHTPNKAEEAYKHITWTHVFRDAVMMSEEWCATMRLQADMLNNLHFKSIQQKADLLEKLQQQGIKRILAHRQSDDHVIRLRSLGGAVFVLHSLPIMEKNQILIDIYKLIHREIFRLDSSFRRLDTAIRIAESRLTLDIINSWVTESTGGDICAICMCDLEVHEAILRLPCGHYFHTDCAQTWLHSKTSCPYCRASLSDTKPCISGIPQRGQESLQENDEKGKTV